MKGTQRRDGVAGPLARPVGAPFARETKIERLDGYASNARRDGGAGPLARPVGAPFARETKIERLDGYASNARRDRGAGPLARPVGAPLARETKNGAPGRSRTCDLWNRNKEMKSKTKRYQ